VTWPLELTVNGPKRLDTETPDRLAVTRVRNGPRNEGRSSSFTGPILSQPASQRQRLAALLRRC